MEGASSLRVYVYTVSAELRFLFTWLIIRNLSKGKSWRFVLMLPISITSYQLLIRVFVLQKAEFNDVNVKLILTSLVFIILIAFYYFKKKKSYKVSTNESK